MERHHLPVIDMSAPGDVLASQIGHACREYGFFYIVAHGVDEDLQQRLEQLSRQFFAQELDVKLQISMSRGGRAWRGYFPVGGELTSGKPDIKEGIYFGAELSPNDPLVQAGTPLHGSNLFPSEIPAFGTTVLAYMKEMTDLGHTLISAISLSLGLPESYFADHYTSDPLILFRIFNYPPSAGVGVGEHTDYGLLTILKQDMSGGLQVKTKSRWFDVTPIPNSFVCNVGDMLDRITGGHYLSAPHRVQSPSRHDRLSFAFFFDPNFNAEVKPLNIAAKVHDDKAQRWDHLSVHDFRGTYGDYLIGKVSKVFPELGKKVL
jgi:isopenicillin N synthase-like dioxygenase